MNDLSTFQITQERINNRLDKVLVSQFPDKTRQYLQKLIKEGHVLLNNKPTKVSALVQTHDEIKVNFPPPKPLVLEARHIPLNIVYEDNNILVINKPAGMVVHPGAHGSHSEDSVVNAVLFHCKGKLGGIGGVLRPGIVHRLDKDTSGLLVVAKNDGAHQDLSAQFKARTIEKTYYTLVVGHITPQKGAIEAPLLRDRHDRKKMAVSADVKAKMAITKYKVLEYFDGYSFLEIDLLTGRTHQIRAHFSAIGFPLVGDALYGRPKINHYFQQHFALKRQFLHAGKLGFTLPGTQKKVEFEAPLPDDLENVLNDMGRSRPASTV